MIVAKADGQETLQPSQIHGVKSSRLLLVGGFLPDSTSLCTVVEGCTGRPVPSATVEWYYRDTLLYTALTDAEGKARWRDAAYIRNHIGHYGLTIKARKGDDRYAQPWQERFRMPFHKEEREQVRERLYTDRAVYRPGQTVYVGGLCYNERQAESHTVQGR